VDVEHTPLFLGLTRPVSFAGLPIMYLVMLMTGVMLGFIISGSFLFLLIMSGVGYVALRGLAAYDPKIFDVFVAAMKRTPMNAALLRGEGLVYRA
jgi:type IV secretion system protein VirB3